jgi:hypothetical protein
MYEQIPPDLKIARYVIAYPSGKADDIGKSMEDIMVDRNALALVDLEAHDTRMLSRQRVPHPLSVGMKGSDGELMEGYTFNRHDYHGICFGSAQELSDFARKFSSIDDALLKVDLAIKELNHPGTSN